MLHHGISPASWRSIIIVPVLLLGAILSANIVSARPSEQVADTTPPLTQTPTGCVSGWNAIESPNRDPVGDNKLYDVSIISANDIWAVGYSGQYQTGVSTLTMHWDGAQWSIVPSPNPAIGGGILFGVSALSANNVWAVGQGRNGTSIAETLIEHWDGNQWSIVPAPLPDGPATGWNTLNAVEALAPDDIWAVGDDGFLALIMHWDGAEWQIVSHSAAGRLHGVSASSPNDIWAVGFAGSETQTVTMHWNGIQWTVVPSPNPGPYINELIAVEAISPNDAWAVGGADGSLILHWNGTIWAAVTAPPAILLDVRAVAPSDIWAVGFLPSTGEAITMRWNGTQWSRVPGANPDPTSNQLWGLALVSSNEIWAVGCQSGDCTGNGQTRTLIEKYTGSCLPPTVTPIATATPSRTSLPPTETATQSSTSIATLTPTSSPTSVATALSTGTAGVSTTTPTRVPSNTATVIPCEISFSDVSPNSAFYPYIKCLACRSIISGYSDGTFRPNNEVTRGQLSKIVSNSAGFTEDPGEQRFEDVPPTNTFYPWIQRLAARGYIGGYGCGGPGEPCISGKPYFRPNANATRGQISKIVSNARGYTDPPGTQIFEDVPPTYTFYEWVQRLASRNIMSGYPCGGPNEPCVSGKPYFRPQTNATRGQTSKIVSNTFFPECSSPAKL